MKRHMSKRPAFTLIELLVTVGIIAMLLGLVAISFPRFNEREQLTRAVDKLRTGLLTARLWAKRDQVVTGLEFAPAGGPYTSFIYVQQPLGKLIGTADPVAGQARQAILNFSIGNSSLIVANKDYLVLDGDVPHLLNSSTNPVQVASNINFNFTYQTPFRIIRSPQAIPMQEEVFLKPDAGPDIDVSILKFDGSAGSLGNDQILFLPTGTIVNAQNNKFILRVKQTLNDPGSPTENADIFVDSLSGTNRYISPN